MPVLHGAGASQILVALDRSGLWYSIVTYETQRIVELVSVQYLEHSEKKLY
jgi:hypothetical protein